MINIEDKLNEFFDKEVSPLIESKKEAYFDLKFDKEKTSYYEDLQDKKEVQFSFFSIEKPEDLEMALKKMWVNLGTEELLDLVPSIAKLAFSLEQQDKDKAEELSDFVYVMF